MNRSLLMIAALMLIGAAGCAKSKKQPSTLPAAATGSTAKPDSVAQTAKKTEDDTTRAITGLSPASQLLVRTCDNYLSVNPGSNRTGEVMLLKASVLYNSKLYDEARTVYAALTEAKPGSPDAVEAVRLTAQSFYEQKNFAQAQEWYRKLKEVAAGTGGSTEATTRIAESIFRMAEQAEAAQNLMEAATQYERVSMEFPDASFADVSLFNAGLDYEKLSEWQRAILVFQRLKQKYENSKIAPKGLFRAAKCMEKLGKWDDAAQTYLSVITAYPHSEFAGPALYNSGFSLENAGKLGEAAAAFERYAASFPDAKEAPDVLFKAGEVFGKLKDWESVSRVNQLFSRRYGSDRDRAIQALCMGGVALYMQGKEGDAATQLKNAITAYNGLKDPSTTNKYYAAQAQFTIGEICHENHKKIYLTQPMETYRKQLKSKQEWLDKSVEAYGAVIKYAISEWTTRAINQIGQSYEDFALDIFKQQRPTNISLADHLALELGIANAFEEYLVENALHYYEQNVKLGIKEKIEDKYVLASRTKLTYAPLTAGENFLKLVAIVARSQNTGSAEGLAAIGAKLSTLQQAGPFQEKAISLFLKSLELGAKYQQADDFFNRAGMLATGTTLTAAQTYKDVADIARNAPLPAGLSPYELFVYKTKLLKQIEPYEDKALGYCTNVAQIAQAYTLSDESVAAAKNLLPEIYYTRGRCYDILCLQAFKAPPTPPDATAEEAEEYRAQFGEIALTYQEQAQEIYKVVVDDARSGSAAGPFVDHCYARLFQTSPEEYGKAVTVTAPRSLSSDPRWIATTDSGTDWNAIDCVDSSWKPVTKETLPPTIIVSGFPSDSVPLPMWYKSTDGSRPSRLYMRRSFTIDEPPATAKFYSAAIDEQSVFVNGKELPRDTLQIDWQKARVWSLEGALRRGKNVIAVEVRNAIRMGYGFMPLLLWNENSKDYEPDFPAGTKIDKKALVEGGYSFPEVPNFTFAPTAGGSR